MSEEYYWIWRYAAEMPAEGRNSECWPRAMSPLYRPEDGWTARRSNEMIYRSWQSMEQHARQSSAAREVMDGFLGEFEQILRGERRWNEKRTARQERAAAEFAASFVPIKAGTFKLGRPKDKPVPPDEEQFQRYRRWFEDHTHEQIVEELWPQGTFSGPEGAQRRQELQAWARSILSERNGPEQLARVFASPNIDNEVVEDRQQKMQAYELCRDPVLNRWYRLFDPQHGLRPSWYREDYARYSPAAGTPVIYVSWYDAWVFSRWARWAGVSCHLPSERQWEYAAKAGKDDWHYWWGDDFSAEKCNADQQLSQTTAPSDSHCNPWGLRDILGNVWEWCQDWYGEYDLDLPDGPGGGSDRVYRGGCWFGWPSLCRSAYRFRSSPEYRYYDLGFRPARSSVVS